MQEYKQQKGSIRRGLKSLVNFPAWMGWSEVKSNARLITGMAKNLTHLSEPEHEETYEQAVARMQLTPSMLAQRERVLFRLACFYFLLTVALLAYTVYLFFIGTWVSVMMSGVLVLIGGSLAFREHFWYFQMRQKRLGCTFKEWLLFFIQRNQL